MLLLITCKLNKMPGKHFGGQFAIICHDRTNKWPNPWGLSMPALQYNDNIKLYIAGDGWGGMSSSLLMPLQLSTPDGQWGVGGGSSSLLISPTKLIAAQQ